MPPRTILYTGKGGVGKTSVAAATARRCAAAGARTLVISTDPAHSLADVLDTPVHGSPTEISERLFAQQVQAQDELEHHWSAVSEWLGGVLMERGVDRIAAEELTVPPGGDELFSLLVLKGHVESGEWDVIVVDCAPTGETLRPKKSGKLRFKLSKISRVSVRVTRGSTVVATINPGVLYRGTKSLAWTAPKKTGTYAVSVTATDLAGNTGSGAGEVEVQRRP